MAHDAFISYSQKDKLIANAVCAALEHRRVRCWIAPRDMLPGTEYAEAIVDGIENSQVFIVVFSSDADASPQVRREVERAVSKGKIILPFRIEDVLPSKAMEFCLSNTHWLDALSPPLEAHLSRLCDTVARLLAGEAPPPAGDPARAISSVRGEPRFAYKYESKCRIAGIPLVCVTVGSPNVGGRCAITRGIVAIGCRPRGVIAIGSRDSVGIIACGRVAVGVVTVAFLSIGGVSIGAVALGLLGAYGVISTAAVALGCVGAGVWAHGFYMRGPFVLDQLQHDQPAVDFFRSWCGPWLHAAAITLCFASILAPGVAEIMTKALFADAERRGDLS